MKSLLIFALAGFTIFATAQTTREKIGLGAGGFVAPAAPIYATATENLYRKIGEQVYRADQWPVISGVIQYKTDDGALILYPDPNQVSGIWKASMALKNFTGDGVKGVKVLTRAMRMGTYNWGNEPLELWDCGTNPAPGEIYQIQAEEDKIKKQIQQEKAAREAMKAREIADKKEATAARALKSNQDAAAKGDIFGQLRMGERYRDGDGVEKDLSKARDYLQKAADAGSPTAKDELSKLPSTP